MIKLTRNRFCTTPSSLIKYYVFLYGYKSNNNNIRIKYDKIAVSYSYSRRKYRRGRDHWRGGR